MLTFDPDYEYWIASKNLSLYSDYKAIKELNENTIVNTCDFSESYDITFIYQFSVNEDTTDVLKTANLYSAILSNGRFTGTLARALSAEAEINSLNEIVRVNATSNTNNDLIDYGTISISTTIPKETDELFWCRSVNNALIEYKKETVDRICDHNLKLVAINVKKGDGTSFVKTQNNKQSEITNARMTFENAMLNTSDETKYLVDRIINENRDTIKYADLKTCLDKEWPEYSQEVVKKQEEELQRQKDIAI